jgi:cytochrome c oxidase accessory protein FixG
MADTGTQALYEKRIPIYPRSVQGRFRSFKWGILALAYGVYFLLPWLPWNRELGPDHAVVFDIASRRFYLFDLVVHAQDMMWLAGFLLIAALLLFFVTGLAGRVFCGYFCFQTLWTDLYILIERLVQGERPARIRLDKAPWSGEKVIKKTATHVLWLLAAFWTGLTFTLYWAEAPRLLVDFFTGKAPFPAYATTLFLTATTYVMAGLAREQVCTYMCPYARFQSVMFDRDTLVVAYGDARGEGSQGRHKIRAGLKTREERQAQGVGDCIDCGYCVQVCPTGIDIRNGLQYQCISCALCIDACDTIMDSLSWPRGLIKYTSEREQQGGKTRWLTAKNLGYGITLVIATMALIWSVLHQVKLDSSVSQIRNPLYVVLSDGRIQNSYEIKLNNKTSQAMVFALELGGLPGAELDLGRLTNIEVPPERSLRIMARVRLEDAGEHQAARGFEFLIRPLQGPADLGTVRQSATFHTPGQGGHR